MYVCTKIERGVVTDLGLDSVHPVRCEDYFNVEIPGINKVISGLMRLLARTDWMMNKVIYSRWM